MAERMSFLCRSLVALLQAASENAERVPVVSLRVSGLWELQSLALSESQEGERGGV